MVSFESIVKDIEDIKIQGAQNVAQAAAKAIGIVAGENRSKPRQEFLHKLNHAKLVLLKTRPTEPTMRNVLSYLFFNIESAEDLMGQLSKQMAYIEEHFKRSKETIAKIGAKKIRTGDVVFTHCHSSTVIEVLKKAKKEGKRFKVYNTETRPLFQGRLTARELARAGIPVVHFVDSGARIALKEADIMLIGADAISSEGKVFNKIGSELFAEVAEQYDTSVYVCTDSWKFDPQSIFGYEEEIEKRPAKEVWVGAPRGVQIDNRAFEKINPELITGVISELGVYNPAVFIEEVKRAHPWIL